MKLVSAAKLRRAQEAVESARPYSDKILETVSALALRSKKLGEAPHPLLAVKEETKKVEVILMTSDRGLCGGFNSNTIRKAQRFLYDKKDVYEQIDVSTVGKKGYEALKRDKVESRKYYEGVSKNVTFAAAKEIADEMCHHYTEGDLDAVYLVYNNFKNAATQELKIVQILPIIADESVADDLVDYEYSPSREELLNGLLPQYFATTVYRALLESQASEHGARMSAMEAATNNAKEMSDKLTLHYNRARQAAITTELMEIIGGAEALK